MSEQKKIKLFERIRKGILKAQKQLFERKAKLGESVVFGNENGQSRIIPASEALAELKRLHPEI